MAITISKKKCFECVLMKCKVVCIRLGLLLFQLCIAWFFFSYFRCKNWTQFSFFLFNHWILGFFFFPSSGYKFHSNNGRQLHLAICSGRKYDKKYWSYKNLLKFPAEQSAHFFRLAKNLKAKIVDYRSYERFFWWLVYMRISELFTSILK